jgi:exodeoxyribonuclease-3
LDDVWSHKQLLKVVSHTPVEVETLLDVQKSGNWVDVIRQFIPNGKLYSWWSYRAKDWQKADKGRRLDHVWATRDIAPFIEECYVVKEVRGWDRPSDHVPVFAIFDF